MLTTAELYAAAIANDNAKRAAEEALKTGKWRAGGSGLMLEGSEKYIGACMRKALLRSAGIEAETHALTTQLMFELGLSNEDIWFKRLLDAGVPQERILREEAIPTKWETTTGVFVTGRPDIVLMDEQGKPEKVFELKSVSSLWTAKSVLLEGKPKDAHLIQAAHYFWQLGANSAELLYTSRVNYAIGKNYHGMFMKTLARRPELNTYFKGSDDGFLKNTVPFFVSYEMDWHTDGHLLYRQVLMDGVCGQWERTAITTEGIRRYYETLSSSVALGKLPARPSQTTVSGSRANYRDCSYCPLVPVCDKAEGKGLAVWKDEVVKWNGQSEQIDALELLHKIHKKK